MDIKRFLGRYWLIKLFPGTNILCYLHFLLSLSLLFLLPKNKNASLPRQLFFQARQEHGAIMELLYYIRCWTNLRGRATLVVFNPQFSLIKKLAKEICPTAQIICPPILLSNLIQKSFGSFLRYSVFPPLYYKFLRKYPEAIYILWNGEGSQWPYVKHLDNVYKNRNNDSPFWDAYVQTNKVLDRRFEVIQDFFQIAEDSRGITVDGTLNSSPVE